MMMSLEQWLTKIESLHSNEIDLGLERVSQVADLLQVTHFKCPVITIAGTNGKGSCVTFLESILSHAGYKVGCYTSPHLLSFNERIRINGQAVSDELLCQAFEKVEAARTTTSLTFFEFTTLAALEIFQSANLDLLILEVGLGGRLDAVNIVDADIGIVTTIALDHVEWLGHDREAIGFEKAGIFKPGKIAICGDLDPPKTLIEQAEKNAGRFYCLGPDFRFGAAEEEIPPTRFARRPPLKRGCLNGSSAPFKKGEGHYWSWESAKVRYDNLPLPSLPLQSAASALMAISVLKDFQISQENISQGLSRATLAGRFQKQGRFILDVAHNPQAADLLAKNIQHLKSKGKLVAVVGMLADKDIPNTLRPLIPSIKEWHLATLSTPRGASANVLADHLRAFAEVNCYTYDSVSAAIQAIVTDRNPDDRILVFGSFYTVAEALQLLNNEV